MDIIILPKDEKLDSEGDITGLLEVTVQVGCPMERYASRKALGFARDVISSPIRFTIVNKLDVIVLQCIMTPLFVSLDMFDV